MSKGALSLHDPAELLIAMFGAFEAEVLSFPNAGAPSQEALNAFAPDLVIGEGDGTPAATSFAAIMSGLGKDRSGRPDFRIPILALALPGARGEALHKHRTLVATGISVGAFYLMAEDVSVPGAIASRKSR